MKVLFVATIVAILLGFPGAASAAETLTLDTRGAAGSFIAGPVSSTAVLASGETYYVRVSGTASIWSTSQWQTGATPPCGAPDAAPANPTPGVANGPASWDADTVWAIPAFTVFQNFTCAPASIPFHVPTYSTGGLQFSTGGAYSHLEPIGGARSTPRDDHTYTYEVTGSGQPFGARFVDKPLEDNYGRFTIELLTAAECAATGCVASAQRSNDQSSGAAGQSSNVPLLAAARTCVSRRNFGIRVKRVRGVRIVSATVHVNGKRVAVLRGKRLRSRVDLRGLPKGRFSVRVVARTNRGQRIVDVRRYRTCVPKRA